MNSVTIPDNVSDTVAAALHEDVGSGDITAALIPAGKIVSASIIAREPGVLCGVPWAEEVFRQLEPQPDLVWRVEEGAEFDRDVKLVELKGPARALMTGERCALNFLQTLSGTATITREWVSRIAHTNAKILDTRKTIPGLRSAQKYAVRIGGGMNHRLGLFDAFLIKENHIAACAGIEAAIQAARQLHPDKPVEIEVRNLAELEQAIAADADTVMLDNFTIEQMREAVSLNSGRVKLEASGGIDEGSLVSVAETGVDYISVGALTKHCRAIDLSLLLD